jgi:hypothetical protein
MGRSPRPRHVASRTIARIAADAKHDLVAPLLTSDNVWLRAGALRGLTEANTPGVKALLQAAAEEENPAVVRHEARVQLRCLEQR